MSTTSTYYANAADGYMYSQNATYATARSTYGGGSLDNASVVLAIGQRKTGGPVYLCYEGFIYFNTSDIPDDNIIESATLSLWTLEDDSLSDFTTEARLHTWSGGGLTSADWVAGADMSGKTLLATFASAAYANEVYNAFTSEAAFLSSISKTGNTEILLCSKQQTDNTTPTQDEYIVWYSADMPGQQPKLVVVHSVPAVPFSCVINTSSVA